MGVGGDLGLVARRVGQGDAQRGFEGGRIGLGEQVDGVADRRAGGQQRGQAAPMLLRACGEMERLDVGGPPIGLIPVAPYREATIDLQPGDLLVVFSDGVSEVNNPAGDIWNEEELEQVVRSCAGLSARESRERILDAAARFGGGADPADDLTLTVFRCI